MSKNSIKIGDIFALGDQVLACGDAGDSVLVAKLLGKRKIDLILTDPPYGVAVVESKESLDERHKAIANDQLQTDAEYQAFTQKWLAAAKEHLSPTNAYYIFNSDKMIFALRAGLLAEKFKFSQLLIWVKTGAVLGRLNYLPQHELISYGWFGRHKFYKAPDKSVLIQPKIQKNTLHPATKPIPLIRRMILNSSKIGDTIYDPFLGSGTTLLASEQTKRKCIAIELDPDYCQVVIDRWEKLTGNQANPIQNGS